MKNTFVFLVLLFSSFSYSKNTLEQFQSKPKLVVLLVIDQFRSDYLTRYQKRFLPGKSDSGSTLGGFNFLMGEGAYFPFAEYDVFQNMTCPGHAIISTGSYPVQNGIAINDFYDFKTNKLEYCVGDSIDQVSPRKLKTTTFADEIKNADIKSRSVTLALKDRSAILLGGHRADVALWMDTKEYQWRSSTYYTNSLPKWVSETNAEVKSYGSKERTWLGKKYNPLSKQGLSSDFGADITFDLAKAAIIGEKLGKQNGTDVLTMSLSTHDILGHMYGPNSKEIEEMTIYEDKKISEFLNFLKKHMGSMKDVVFILTADHGVAPTVDMPQKSKMETGKIDYLNLHKVVYAQLNKKFNISKEKNWFVASTSLQFYINREIIKSEKLNIIEVEDEAKRAMLDLPGVAFVVTRSEIMKGLLPAGEMGAQIRRQFIDGQSGDVIVVPRPFFMETDEHKATHITGYTYDRMVPLIFYGSKFKKGVYSEGAKIIDLAPTLSFSLGILPPATSEGKVLPIF